MKPSIHVLLDLAETWSLFLHHLVCMLVHDSVKLENWGGGGGGGGGGDGMECAHTLHQLT